MSQRPAPKGATAPPSVDKSRAKKRDRGVKELYEPERKTHFMELRPRKKKTKLDEVSIPPPKREERKEINFLEQLKIVLAAKIIFDDGQKPSTAQFERLTREGTFRLKNHSSQACSYYYEKNLFWFLEVFEEEPPKTPPKWVLTLPHGDLQSFKLDSNLPPKKDFKFKWRMADHIVLPKVEGLRLFEEDQEDDYSGPPSFRRVPETAPANSIFWMLPNIREPLTTNHIQQVYFSLQPQQGCYESVSSSSDLTEQPAPPTTMNEGDDIEILDVTEVAPTTPPHMMVAGGTLSVNHDADLNDIVIEEDDDNGNNNV